MMIAACLIILAVVVLVSLWLQGDKTSINSKRTAECVDAFNQYANHVADLGGKVQALTSEIAAMKVANEKLAENFSLPNGLLPAPLAHAEDEITPALPMRDEPTQVTRKRKRK